MSKREFKPRYRSNNVRDAKLIVIATEGANTETKYFQDIISPEYYHNSKVHVAVLNRETTASSPEHIIKLLDKFRREFQLNKYDELWMVIDVDAWGDNKLSLIAAQCEQKGFYLAVSNPSFELWLLLHLKSLNEYTQTELDEFLENKKVSRKTKLERELSNLLGSFNKSNLDTTPFLPHVNKAIDRATKLDINNKHRWPVGLGSRVYLLVGRIIKPQP